MDATFRSSHCRAVSLQRYICIRKKYFRRCCASKPPAQCFAGGTRLSRPFDGNSLTTNDHQLTTALEWCERRLLARIHRLTLGRLRKEIEPVTPAQFMRWLLRWQHAEPGSQASGEQGLLEIVRQLQGFEVPANAWERHVLARRLRDYDPDSLDELCLTGAVGWGRLSPHPATIETNTDRRTRRIVPTSVAPITLFLREESDWMAMNPHLGVGAMRDASRRNLQRPQRHLRARSSKFFVNAAHHSCPTSFVEPAKRNLKLKVDCGNSLPRALSPPTASTIFVH